MNPILSKAAATSAPSSSTSASSLSRSCDEQLVPGSGSSVISDNENLGGNLTDMEEEPNNVKNLGGGPTNSVVSESGSGNSRKRLYSGDFATTGSQTIDLSRDASGSGVGCKSLGENSGPVTSNIPGASENRVAANAPKPLPKRRIEKVATVDVNGVFFMRTNNLFGMYEFGVAESSVCGWRISSINHNENITYDKLAEVVYIRKLPKGLNVYIPKPGKAGGFYDATLTESVSRITNTCRIRVRVPFTGCNKTVPLSVIRVLQQEVNHYISASPDCFLRVFGSNSIQGWIHTDLLRNGKEATPPIQSGSKRKCDTNDFITSDKSDSIESSRKRLKGDNTSSAIVLNKRIRQKICDINNLIVKHDLTGKVVGRLETKVTGSLVAHQTMTLYSS